MLPLRSVSSRVYICNCTVAYYYLGSDCTVTQGCGGWGRGWVCDLAAIFTTCRCVDLLRLLYQLKATAVQRVDGQYKFRSPRDNLLSATN